MKVTRNDDNSGKLNTGYLQKVSSEKREYAKVQSYEKITENNATITTFETDKLLVFRCPLNELDKELTKSGHRFVRYADDLMIFCSSKRSTKRVLGNIPEWKVYEIANFRKGALRLAIVLNSILTNKEIAKLGYLTLLDIDIKINMSNFVMLYYRNKTIPSTPQDLH